MIAMRIRKATASDFTDLYSFALQFPEFRVSATEPFMQPDEFKAVLSDPDALILIAEDKDMIGFIYARTRDLDKPSFQNTCIVYLAVDEKHRKKGIATKLFNECIAQLKAKGVTYIFTWANAESPLIKEFMKKRGFVEGHTYTWMDKKL